MGARCFEHLHEIERHMTALERHMIAGCPHTSDAREMPHLLRPSWQHMYKSSVVKVQQRLRESTVLGAGCVARWSLRGAVVLCSALGCAVHFRLQILRCEENECAR